MNQLNKFKVYRKARDLNINVFQLLKQLPSIEKYALQDQINRSSGSVLRNISEGIGRYKPKEKIHFYEISKGLAYELHAQVIVGLDRGYFKKNESEEILSILNEIIKMLNSMIFKMKQRINNGN